MTSREAERNQEATVYLVSNEVAIVGIVHWTKLTAAHNINRSRQGNLDERCTDALIWELMLQAGPICELLTLPWNDLPLAAQCWNRALMHCEIIVQQISICRRTGFPCRTKVSDSANSFQKKMLSTLVVL